MYETFYRLSATPFRLTPDPEFCFPHSGYAQAHAYLQYAFELGEGFIVLTGRVGAGKTTLVKAFLKELEARDVATATIAAANIEATDLLRCVAYAYGIEAENLDKATLLKRIAQHLSALMHRRRRALLVIDEAQGLSPEALEELRLLADLAEDARPLLQIFLVGQEKLRSLMRDPGMEQLRQRVTGTCRLEPMGLAETRDYIQHRLRCAGWGGDPQLTGDAVVAIFRYSGGTPRHVNKICTRLMLQGFMESKHILDKADVTGIAEELDEEQLAPAPVAVSELGEGGADPVTLSALAIRAARPVRAAGGMAAVPLPAQAPLVPAVREPPLNDAPAPAPVEPPHRKVRSGIREAPSQHMREWRRFDMADGAKRAPLWSRRPQSGFHALAQQAVRKVLRLEEVPALLFGMVAGVTVFAASVTSYVQHRAVESQNLFILDSQPLQGARDSIGGGGGNAQPVPPQQGVVAAAPTQETGQATAQTPDRHPPARGKSGVDADGRQHQASPPGKPVASVAAAAETSPIVSPVVVQTHDVPDVVPRAPVGSGTGSDAASDAGVASPRMKAATDIRPGDPPDAAPDKPATGAALGHAAAASAADGKSKVAGNTEAPDPRAVSGAARPSASETRRADPKAVTAKKVGNLVALAGRALDENRLLIPPGNSAYSYYGRVLSLDPGNEEALTGLKRIVERYITMASDAIEHRDKARAMLYVDRGLRVQPKNDRLLVLRDMIGRLSIAGQSGQPPSAPHSGGYRLPAAALERPPGETPQPDGVLDWVRHFFQKKPHASVK